MLLDAPRHQNHAQQHTYLSHGPSTPRTPGHSAPFPSPHFFSFLWMLDVVFCCNCGQYTCLLSPSSNDNKKTTPTFSRYPVCSTRTWTPTTCMWQTDDSSDVPGGCDFCVGPKASTQPHLHPLSHSLHVEMLRMCFRGLRGINQWHSPCLACKRQAPGFIP